MNNDNYYRTKMQKELILKKLKENGCRITKQRKLLLDIILENDFSCCKEIYYKASCQDSSIGTATVYRMINLLEEIGAISRKSIYRVLCEEEENSGGEETSCVVEFDDHSTRRLSANDWNSVVKEGLKACGYLKSREVLSVSFDRAVSK